MGQAYFAGHALWKKPVRRLVSTGVGEAGRKKCSTSVDSFVNLRFFTEENGNDQSSARYKKKT